MNEIVSRLESIKMKLIKLKQYDLAAEVNSVIGLVEYYLSSQRRS